VKDINTCYPGEIVEFDPVTQFATVRVAIEQYFKWLGKEEEEYTKVPKPLIYDVPVQFPFGGGYSITMPVKSGDSCLVIFAQRGIDHWLYDGLMEAGKLDNRPSPQHLRYYNHTDALCIVGFNPETKPVTDFNPDHLVIRNKENTTKITIKPEEVVVDAVSTVVVNSPDVVVNATTVTMNATTVAVNGNLTISGTTTSQGEVTGNGVGLSSHKHAHGTPNTSTGQG